MTELLSDIDTPSDAELISRVRGGDVAAYGELFSRHVQAATRLARQLVRGPDADDLVSDAFAKVLSVLQGGGGPDVAFRAYLLTAVRRLHVDRVRAGSRLQTSDDMAQFDPGIPFQDTAVSGFESGAAAKAFASLPERWQLVLWHLEVEGQKPADIAPLLGMSANSVSALAYRAREGLRQAFLTMHLSDISAEQCRWVNEHLGAYVRNGLAKRDAAKVDAHLKECRRCTAMYLELTEVNSDLKAIIAPLLLGAAAAGYLTSTGSAGTAGALAVLGRLRDAVLANASVAATGAAAAGVAAVATTVVLVTHHGAPATISSADRPIAATTQVTSAGVSSGVPSDTISGAASPASPSSAASSRVGSLALSPASPVGAPGSWTTPGALLSPDPSILVAPVGAPGTGPGSSTAPSTPAAPASSPAGTPSSPQSPHSPTGPSSTPPPPQHSTPPPTHQPTPSSPGPSAPASNPSTPAPTTPAGPPTTPPSAPGGPSVRALSLTAGAATISTPDEHGAFLVPVTISNLPSDVQQLTFTVAEDDPPTLMGVRDFTASNPVTLAGTPTVEDAAGASAGSCTISGTTATCTATASVATAHLPVALADPATTSVKISGTAKSEERGDLAATPTTVTIDPPTADLAFRLDSGSVTPDSAGGYTVTGTVSGIPAEYYGYVSDGLPTYLIIAVDPSAAVSIQSVTTTCPSSDSTVECSVELDLVAPTLTDATEVTLKVNPLRGYADDVADNSVPVTLQPASAPSGDWSVDLVRDSKVTGNSRAYTVTVSGGDPDAALSLSLESNPDSSGKPVVFTAVPDSCTPPDSDGTEVFCRAAVGKDGGFSGQFTIKLPSGQLDKAVLTVTDGAHPVHFALAD